MNTLQSLRLFLLMLLFLLTVPTALAHDPGLSRSTLEITRGEVALRLEIASEDLATLGAFDTNVDGKVSTAEIRWFETEFTALIRGDIVLNVGGERLRAAAADIKQSQDGIIIELHYPLPVAAASLELELPLITRFVRGHRHYLKIVGAQGEFRSQHLLSSTSAALEIELTGPHQRNAFWDYLYQGVWHIWIGLDHILFLVTLVLPSVVTYRHHAWHSLESVGPAFKDMVKTVTAFTVAHSLTLVAGVTGVLVPTGRIVESLIAVSVLLAALNNLRPVVSASRWFFAFVFGLVHGFGFADVLMNLNLPEEAFALSLFAFNLGVELGQLVIVAVIFPLLAFLRNHNLYQLFVLKGGSVMAAFIAAIWVVERSL